jgi:aryl-alcohol dehydrogenase-like predicted oxidoreductase
MCEDQGMAITLWVSLGGGQLKTKEQREKLKGDPDAGHGYYEATGNDIRVCEVLEDIVNRKSATLQDIVRHPVWSDVCTD